MSCWLLFFHTIFDTAEQRGYNCCWFYID